MARVAKGEDICLQGNKSDIQLHITAGCPKRPHLMEVRTDLSSFATEIPDDECFIAPVVDVLAPTKTNTSAYVLHIPHCLSAGDDKMNVKVRMWIENRHPAHAVVQVPPRDTCTDGVLFYDIDDNFIELHTPHFCKIICTICQTPYNCLDRVINFCCAKFNTHLENHNVEVRPYFCSVPHLIKDLRQVCQQHLAGSFTCTSGVPHYDDCKILI